MNAEGRINAGRPILYYLDIRDPNTANIPRMVLSHLGVTIPMVEVERRERADLVVGICNPKNPMSTRNPRQVYAALDVLSAGLSSPGCVRVDILKPFLGLEKALGLTADLIRELEGRPNPVVTPVQPKKTEEVKAIKIAVLVEEELASSVRQLIYVSSSLPVRIGVASDTANLVVFSRAARLKAFRSDVVYAYLDTTSGQEAIPPLPEGSVSIGLSDSVGSMGQAMRRAWQMLG